MSCALTLVKWCRGVFALNLSLLLFFMFLLLHSAWQFISSTLKLAYCAIKNAYSKYVLVTAGRSTPAGMPEQGDERIYYK